MEAQPPRHVAFLHEKLGRRKRDRYILNLAQAYHQLGFRVTLYAAQFSHPDLAESDFQFLQGITVKTCGGWLPRSLFGRFRSWMSTLKSMCMAARMICHPTAQKPQLVVLDVGLVALYLLHFFSSYRIFYVEYFETLRNRPDLCEHLTHSPSLLEAKFIKLADQIIVDSCSFQEIFKKSFPSVGKDPVVLYPAVDVGLWNLEGIQVKRIIPDLLDNSILFLSIGKYRRSSNFKLALDSFEILLQLINDQDTTKRFQLVIAGNCKTLEEKLHYNDLVVSAKERICASQVTFLNQLPIVHQKTLISEAAIVIFPSKSEMQADYLLKAMSLGKPIVATTRGIAPKLLQNRVSGITTEPEAKLMAQVLKKLMMSPHLQSFIGEIARDSFVKNYCFRTFCKRVGELTDARPAEEAKP